MYQAYITKIKDLRKHSNADRLMCGRCFESNVIVGLDANMDDLIVFFPTDGQLSEEYATKHNLVRTKDENGNNTGGYLDPNKRNIRSLKLRGEMSDGLVMPLESLKDYTDITQLNEGDTITVLNRIEICCKYIPNKKKGSGTPSDNSKKLKIKQQYPYFSEHIDTSQLQYNLRNFHEGDLVTISLKLHGTSHRETIALEHKERKQNIVQKLFRKKPIIDKNWTAVAGSRRVILNDFEGGYYSSNDFRKTYHDFFKDKLYHGETAYLEIVGYTGDNCFIMDSCSNSKVSDKAFTNKFGKTTEFTYGCKNGQSDCYVYRMTMTNDEGVVTEYPTWYAQYRCEQMGVKHVPVLEQFVFSNEEDLMNRVNAHVDGVDGMPADLIGLTHILEGAVVRIENRSKFTAYKHKNFYFKVLEGIIKDEAITPDIEEEQEVND